MMCACCRFQSPQAGSRLYNYQVDEDRPVSLGFQSPQAGSRLCNPLHLLVASSPFSFQSPQAGRCLCNRSRLYRKERWNDFQSPQTGSHLCNRPRRTAPAFPPGLSVPSNWVAPLQLSKMAGSRCQNRPFSPLQPGYTSAAYPIWGEPLSFPDFSTLKRGRASATPPRGHGISWRCNFSPLKPGCASRAIASKFLRR